MPDYSIWILEYSYSNKFHKSGVIYSAHNEGYIKLPYCYTVIKGNGHVAMVDVGYTTKTMQRNSPRACSSRIGIRPR